MSTVSAELGQARVEAPVDEHPTLRRLLRLRWGVAERMVVIKHAFRNACIPVITVLGLQFGQLLGGAIITETVFAWPGVATLTVDSIRNQDFPVVQCAVILLALLIVGVNLIVDLIVGVIDPRIRART